MLNRDFKEFAESLAAQGVEYLLIGGYALAAHGHPRYTGDIDFWIGPAPANIDRLLNDRRTRPVDIITRIDNADDKENLRITLVMKSHNLYIPGYRMKDGTYAFSHSDGELMLLPIGAKALVVATAGTESGTVFAMQPIVVEREGRIDLHLTPTTETELKQALLAAL